MRRIGDNERKGKMRSREGRGSEKRRENEREGRRKREETRRDRGEQDN